MQSDQQAQSNYKPTTQGKERPTEEAINTKREKGKVQRGGNGFEKGETVLALIIIDATLVKMS